MTIILAIIGAIVVALIAFVGGYAVGYPAGFQDGLNMAGALRFKAKLERQQRDSEASSHDPAA